MSECNKSCVAAAKYSIGLNAVTVRDAPEAIGARGVVAGDASLGGMILEALNNAVM